MPDYTVVVDDCATPAKPAIQNVRFRNTKYERRNFTYNYNDLVNGLPRPLTEIQQDWLDIFGSIFAADCVCERAPGTSWNRRIDLYVPCRVPEYWGPFILIFEELFGQLTYDHLTLNLVPDPMPTAPPRQKTQEFAFSDCVALFSGGMDSFVGDLLLQEQGRFPTLVSHVGPPAARTAQNALYSRFGKVGSRATIVAQRLQPDRNAPRLGQENSQRSRSLLFMAAACLVASALEVSDVYVNENGVMAIHLPMTEARLGSLSTRTASPAILKRFGAAATGALGMPITVHNNLLKLTKVDVAGEGVRLGQEPWLQRTISCWSIGRTMRHCGWCVPCLIRRIACEYQGVQDADYELDAFNMEPKDTKARDNLVHLAMLANDLVSMSDVELELEYPELLFAGEGLAVPESLELHRRWGHQATRILSNHSYSASLL